MKMALDYWYDLWDTAGSRDRHFLDQLSEEEDQRYPLEQDYQAWLSDKEAASDNR